MLPRERQGRARAGAMAHRWKAGHIWCGQRWPAEAAPSVPDSRSLEQGRGPVPDRRSDQIYVEQPVWNHCRGQSGLKERQGQKRNLLEKLMGVSSKNLCHGGKGEDKN